jgi:hypothetical protein
VIEELATHLRTHHPDLVFECGENALLVPATSEDGFSVGLRRLPGVWEVSYDAWHHQCTTEEEALDYFRNGLTGAARLRITSRGGQPYRWQAEVNTHDAWRPDWIMRRFFFPFWQPKSERTLRNTGRSWSREVPR